MLPPPAPRSPRMATHTPVADALDYPTSDGKPMAETETHRDDMMDLIQTAQDHFAADPMICVSGNMLMFYEEGNRRKHVSPDVFVVRGIPKRTRQNYLVWLEGKGPDLVIELTSKSTRREDEGKKLALYRDVLNVPEYFLFDPFADYLRPPFQGYRLVDGDYRPIMAVDRRLPSEVLGLHLERYGTELRLFDPAIGRRLETRRERASRVEAHLRQAEDDRRAALADLRLAEIANQLTETARQLSETARQQAETSRQQAEVARQQAEAANRRSEAERDVAIAEADQLRRELEELRRRARGPS